MAYQIVTTGDEGETAVSTDCLTTWAADNYAEITGISYNPRTRAELQGHPTMLGFVGPCWGGWTETKAPTRTAAAQRAGSRRSIHHFDNEAEAIQYREDHGTGGWAFVCTDKGEATIFPPNMTPTDILRSGMTSQSGGRFIGSTGKIARTKDLA